MSAKVIRQDGTGSTLYMNESLPTRFLILFGPSPSNPPVEPFEANLMLNGPWRRESYNCALLVWLRLKQTGRRFGTLICGRFAWTAEMEQIRLSLVLATY